MSANHEFQLLTERRFGPLFATQFLGALNDNLFKNALILLIAFGKPPSSFMSQDTLINVCAALFILPYFLFSAFAGQLADKFEKSFLIRIIKLVEIILAILAMLGFYFDNLILLLSALFLLGTQATFFGPLKYSILPQHLEKTELIGGNGLIEMGTFLAILLGTILGAVLIAIPATGTSWVAFAMLALALFGFFSSLFIPKAPSDAPYLTVSWNIFTQTIHLIKEACQNKIILHSIIGISWFWLFGSIILTQTANYTKIVLGGDEYVTSLLLVAFSIGIGLGSVLCEWLSAKKIEIGFVFLGSIGLTLYTLDLAFSNSPLPTSTLGPWAFLTYGQNYRIVIDALLIGAFGGVYLVPLYTLLQTQSNPAFRSRTIAANNIVNAIFMVGASILAIVVLNMGFSIPQLFILTAVLNAGIGIYLIKLGKLLKHQDNQKEPLLVGPR